MRTSLATLRGNMLQGHNLSSQQGSFARTREKPSLQHASTSCPRFFALACVDFKGTYDTGSVLTSVVVFVVVGQRKMECGGKTAAW